MNKTLQSFTKTIWIIFLKTDSDFNIEGTASGSFPKLHKYQSGKPASSCRHRNQTVRGRFSHMSGVTVAAEGPMTSAHDHLMLNHALSDWTMAKAWIEAKRIIHPEKDPLSAAASALTSLAAG